MKEARPLLFKENKEYWFVCLWRRVVNICRVQEARSVSPLGAPACLGGTWAARLPRKRRKEGGVEEGAAGRGGHGL